MAHSNKQVFSGIRSVKRDYSSNFLPSSSQESGPSLPSQRHDTEKRLKEIQKALEEQNASSQRVLAMTAPAQSNHSKLSSTSHFFANGKRPSSSQEESAPKRRELPTSWTPAVKKNYSPTSALPSSQRTSKTQISVKGTPNNKSAPKAPAISLSEEQMHILQLVEEGKSVFYTGSAGECDLPDSTTPGGWYLVLKCAICLKVQGSLFSFARLSSPSERSMSSLQTPSLSPLQQVRDGHSLYAVC